MNNELKVTDEIIRDLYIVRKIDTGGMGIIYICKDLELKFEIVLKTYRDIKVDKNALIVEALNWINLGKHPNIIRAYYALSLFNSPFILLEYVKNELYDEPNLRTFMRQNKYSLEEIIDFSLQICTAMKYITTVAPKLAYLDLKPENILVTNVDNNKKIYKITDFGLSKIINLPMQGRLDDKNGYTYAYASPEQINNNRLADIRSDIYSLGCILFEMITGFCPFIGSASEIIEGHLNKHPSIRRYTIDEVNPVLKNIIFKCLEKKIVDRYKSFEELSNELIKLYFDITHSEWVDFPIELDTNEFKVEKLKNRFQIESQDFWNYLFEPYMESYWYSWET